MHEFKLIYQKPGFVIGPVPGKEGLFHCLWMKSNARYAQGAVRPNLMHICVGQAPGNCIKEIPDVITHTWAETQCQNRQFGYRDHNPSMIMIDKSEETAYGVRANGTLCLGGTIGGKHGPQNEVVATLAEVRERLAPFIK